MNAIRLLLLSLSMGVATALVGWWTVPVIAGAYALARRRTSAPRESMLAALVAWIALFARLSARPAFSTLLDRLGQLFPISGVGVLLLALALVAVLAWSAARVVTGFALSGQRA